MATRLFEELEALSACVREFARFPRYTAISFISPLREEDAPLKYRHGSRPRNSLLSGFRCSSNPPPPARRTRLITRSDDVSNFFTGFSNCETPTRYQATTDSSNSVISRVKRSGAWRAIARCHARNVAPSVKRACKTVNHRPGLRFFARLPPPLGSKTPWWIPIQGRGSEKRTKGDSSRTSCDQEENRKAR